ncbi:EAL domain-containing protein [Hartmannibacter diazotrophicus]|nr:EAL domain-containing protein [Hartmannibacter diazotrophicus]
MLALSLFTLAAPAHAIEAVGVPIDAEAIELTPALELHHEDGDRIQVSTAPGADGIVRRIEVRARDGAEGTNWAVFALANNTDEQLDRLVVAPFFRLSGSGIVWPDLGASRIANITPSQGFAPKRQSSNEADVFLITLDPGTVVTFVAEMRTNSLPRLTLWTPNAYKDSVNSYTLFRGIILGISGLLALFLTILFVVKGSMMFPATAALAWTVLAYLCIDFGFWNKVFKVDVGADQIYRASAEVMIAVSLVIFLYAYLNLGRWHFRYNHVVAFSLAMLCALLGLAFYDPSIAAGIARMALAGLGVAGMMLVLALAFRGYDRAIMLIPTWLIFVAWLTATGFTLAGHLVNDIVQPALSGGLVLIVLLLGFTVMQHAFAGGPIADGLINDAERRALALTGAGDIIWDWDVSRDRIHISSEAESLLGFKRGALEGPAQSWLDYLHAQDRERFRANLDAIVEQRRGRIQENLRMRAKDGHYLWFRLRARPILGADGEVIRCVGTLLDVTESKTAQERLLHDAVHDNLTGLPNRQLFLDRLGIAIGRTGNDDGTRPVVFLLDIDRFRQVNENLGLSIGDSILLTVARRLSRLLKPVDSLARIDGDRFGIILLSEQQPDRVAVFADAVRRAIRAAIALHEQEIFLTASIGIAFHDRVTRDPTELIKDAEIATAYAKQLGGDRIETFRPALRTDASDVFQLENDLRRALEREEMQVHYQPIVRLDTREIVGFEALLRWDHPKRGRVSPADFVPAAERSDQIVQLGLFVLERAARQLSQWHQSLPKSDHLFVSVNVSSRQLLRHDLLNDVKAVLSRNSLPKGALKLEMTESLLMENPEFAAQILHRLRELGASISLDDFGTGYSSLSYLQRLPIDTLKIDQSFVRSGNSPTQFVILRSIMGLAHDLGLETVAEGAETEADAEMLDELGCDLGQGYLFGAPMSADEIRKLMDRQNGEKTKA